MPKTCQFCQQTYYWASSCPGVCQSCFANLRI